jgi:hypothetical protein
MCSGLPNEFGVTLEGLKLFNAQHDARKAQGLDSCVLEHHPPEHTEIPKPPCEDHREHKHRGFEVY